MNWYVVQTKPKWEKKVAEQLQKTGITCYCPTVIKMHQYSDRKKKVEVPLFYRYVFVQLSEKERNLVFLSPGVVKYLFWLGKHAIVKDHEINTIKDWLEKGEKAEIALTQHKVGETIKLNSGAFSNQNAVIKEITKNHYILILEALGCFLKIENRV
jgi:transcription antitermination factor NusG